MKPYFESAGVTIYCGDCREIMPELEQVHAIITDPPYGLEFMGKEWDAPWKTDRRQNFDGTLQDQRDNPYGRSKVRNGNGASYGADARVMQSLQEWYYSWAVEALRVLRPGGHLLSFGGSRTYHRMACAIEDAGFEIRDQIMWLYGSGFPKSLDVSKAIDKAAGAKREIVSETASGGYKRLMVHNAEDGFRPADYYPDGNKFTSNVAITEDAQQWSGYGTALKPAHEPIVVARKPLVGTVAANVLECGTGALNIDECRVAASEQMRAMSKGFVGRKMGRPETMNYGYETSMPVKTLSEPHLKGRWPANVIHDGSNEVTSLFPNSDDGVAVQRNRDGKVHNQIYGGYNKPAIDDVGYGGSGSAARFFYTAKADQNERGVSNNHPTVKPLDLMRYLCKLICPPNGGVLLDPFMGSGSTILAGRRFYQHVIGIELNEQYAEIAVKRLAQEALELTGTIELR